MINDLTATWVHNNIGIAREALDQFLAEKNTCFVMSGTPVHLKTGCLSFRFEFHDCISSPRQVDLKLDPGDTPNDIVEKFILAILSASKKLEEDFIEWLKPSLRDKADTASFDQTYFDSIPIDKFDAVCAQQLADAAIRDMKETRDVRDLSIKIREEIKTEAEHGRRNLSYYFEPEVSQRLISKVIKDLEASWFEVTSPHKVYNSEWYCIVISWDKLNNR